jgi:hypothetical protein
VLGYPGGVVREAFKMGVGEELVGSEGKM